MSRHVVVNNFFERVKKDIERKSVQFVTAVTSVGASYSRYEAPVAYSTLVNSQKISVKTKSGGIVGSVGYYVSYAVYLENGDSWKPKPPPKYGRNGVGRANAWNPNAKPHFLKNGFEGNAPLAEFGNLRRIFKV